MRRSASYCVVCFFGNHEGREQFARHAEPMVFDLIEFVLDVVHEPVDIGDAAATAFV